jgi:protein SCO1/2
MTRGAVALALLVLSLAHAGAADRYAATGIVLSVDRAHRTFIASIDGIPGVMPAMSMPFEVRDDTELAAVQPGAMIEFTLVVEKSSSYVEAIRIRHAQNLEQDPLAARRLSLLQQVTRGGGAQPLAIGEEVPDFRLIDQLGRPVVLSSLRGKVVAVNFMYTACQLPQFCLRIVNHFGALRTRFQPQMGRDLVFLTITFDPIRDQPEVLARYASRWKPDPDTWHFLTGPVADVRRVLGMFGASAFPDEGLMDHSLQTVLIDRAGRLAASVEGNRYSPEQLADLTRSVLRR